MKSLLTTLSTVLRFPVLTIVHFFVKEFVGNLYHHAPLQLLHIPPAGSRILFFIPHPDDEVAACGTFISEALKMNCLLKVVMITNGDGVGLADYLKYKITKPKPRYFKFLAYRRQKETKEALSMLGLARKDIIFLGFPDRCSIKLWRNNWGFDNPCTSPYTKLSSSPYLNSYEPNVQYTGLNLIRNIEQIINSFNPSWVIYPHFYDCHVDHFALNNFIKYVIAKSKKNITELTYLVHRGHWPTPPGEFRSLPLIPPSAISNCGIEWFSLPLSRENIRKKKQCLTQYKSQNWINRIYLSSFLRKNELFGKYQDIDVDLENIRQSGEVIIDFVNPSADTVKGYLHKSADIVGLTITMSFNRLEFIIRTEKPPNKNYRHIFDLIFFMVNDSIHRYTVIIEKDKLKFDNPILTEQVRIEDISYTIGDNYVKIALLYWNIEDTSSIFVNAIVRIGEVLIDRTGSRLIKFVH